MTDTSIALPVGIKRPRSALLFRADPGLVPASGKKKSGCRAHLSPPVRLGSRFLPKQCGSIKAH
jgi:hypothetical protein